MVANFESFIICFMFITIFLLGLIVIRCNRRE